MPLLADIAVWSLNHKQVDPALADVAKQAAEDRDAFLGREILRLRAPAICRTRLATSSRLARSKSCPMPGRRLNSANGKRSRYRSKMRRGHRGIFATLPK